MATTKFVLVKSQKQNKEKTGQSTVMLRYTHRKKTTYFTTSKVIYDKYWDGKNQCVKRSYPGSDRFNMYIKKILEKVNKIVDGFLYEETDPNIKIVKESYNEGKEGKEKSKKYTFWEYVDKFIEDSKKTKTKGTISTYKTVVNKFKAYEKYATVKLSWNNIDMDFYNDFYYYYIEIGCLKTNGFGRAIKILKAILNDATERGFNVSVHYKNRNFKALKEQVDNIYLTELELQKIIDLDLSNNKRLDRMRDLFILGCYTGLRFSDFTRIQENHINGNIIRIKTLKTGIKVSIPLLEPVSRIIEKYKSESYPTVQNQTLNKHLKTIGELAEIDDIIEINGERRIKYEMISTHTARRSFATNMYKRGLGSKSIMKVTGHTTETAFNNYIKITQDENAELFLEAFKNSEKLSINKNQKS